MQFIVGAMQLVKFALVTASIAKIVAAAGGKEARGGEKRESELDMPLQNESCVKAEEIVGSMKLNEIRGSLYEMVKLDCFGAVYRAVTAANGTSDEISDSGDILADEALFWAAYFGNQPMVRFVSTLASSEGLDQALIAAYDHGTEECFDGLFHLFDKHRLLKKAIHGNHIRLARVMLETVRLMQHEKDEHLIECVDGKVCGLAIMKALLEAGADKLAINLNGFRVEDENKRALMRPLWAQFEGVSYFDKDEE